MINIIWVLIWMGFATIIHEIGHAVVALCFRVKVLDVGWGLGPVVGQRTSYTGQKWTLRLWPVGAYCALDRASVEQKPLWVQSAIAGAGIVANLIAAWILTMAMMRTYVPSLSWWHLPKAGLQLAEALLGMAGRALSHHPGIASGRTLSASPLVMVHNVAQAPLIHGTTALALGFLINVVLALTNAIPFPALDGGRMGFLLLTKLRGRPYAHEDRWHQWGFRIIMGGFVLWMIHGVWRV